MKMESPVTCFFCSHDNPVAVSSIGSWPTQIKAAIHRTHWSTSCYRKHWCSVCVVLSLAVMALSRHDIVAGQLLRRGVVGNICCRLARKASHCWIRSLSLMVYPVSWSDWTGHYLLMIAWWVVCWLDKLIPLLLTSLRLTSTLLLIIDFTMLYCFLLLISH